MRGYPLLQRGCVNGGHTVCQALCQCPERRGLPYSRSSHWWGRRPGNISLTEGAGIETGEGCWERGKRVTWRQGMKTIHQEAFTGKVKCNLSFIRLGRIYQALWAGCRKEKILRLGWGQGKYTKTWDYEREQGVVTLQEVHCDLRKYIWSLEERKEDRRQISWGL